MDSIGLSSINYVDLIITGTVLLFIIFGIVRGFTNDILSLFTWLGAIVATKELFPYAQPYARQIVTEPFFSDVILAFIIFIISLIILVFIAKTISNAIRKSALSGLDRTLGIVSGAFRALVILVGLYLTTLMFYKHGDAPEELEQARLIEVVRIPAAMAHQYLIPKDLFPKRLYKHLHNTPPIQGADTIKNLVNGLSSPKPSSQQARHRAAPPKEGYANKERQSLDSLIDRVGQKD